jgi:hypothetical protein
MEIGASSSAKNSANGPMYTRSSSETCSAPDTTAVGSRKLACPAGPSAGQTGKSSAVGEQSSSLLAAAAKGANVPATSREMVAPVSASRLMVGVRPVGCPSRKPSDPHVAQKIKSTRRTD